jgi:hypothetical protein
MTSTHDLAARYIAVWNEPDADRRREQVRALWPEHGRHILQPPQEIREVAARPGLALPATLEALGYEQLDERATSVYEHWVATEGISFRAHDEADRLGELVKLHWEAVTGDGTVYAVGLSLLLLAADGRIERDYTFIVG